MKKTLLLTTIIAMTLLVTTGNATAQRPSGTSPSQVVNNQVNQIKNKIAKQVTQLNLIEKRGVIGTIQDINVSANQITLALLNGNIQYIDVDEITKYSSANSNGTFDLTDLTKGMAVSVLGIYNKESERILARFVNTVVVPTRLTGVIAAVDDSNSILTIMTEKHKEVKVAVDDTSTISSYTTSQGLTSYDFSKIDVGDRIEMDGYPEKTDASMLLVDRLTDFLDAPKDPTITLNLPTPTAEASAAPTSKGAKNISPIK